MKLALHHLSQEDRQKLLTEVFSNQTAGFLNGVDLSTEAGRQKYIAAVVSGKNPFEKSKNEQDEDKNKGNISVSTTTPWSEIIRQSDGDLVVPEKPDIGSIQNPFKNILLNIAYSKKNNEIQMETDLPAENISQRLLEIYSNNLSAQRNLISAVKFFRDITSSIFTECDNCGATNQPLWLTCETCGFTNGGT